MKRFAPRKGMHSCKGMVLILVLAMGPVAAQAAIVTGSAPITGIALSSLAGQPGFFRIGPALPMHAPAQGMGSTRESHSTQGSHPAKGSSAAKGPSPAKGYTAGLPVFHDDYCEQYGC